MEEVTDEEIAELEQELKKLKEQDREYERTRSERLQKIMGKLEKRLRGKK